MFVEKVYTDSKLAVIFLKKANLLIANSIIMDADDVCE
jgi:hypothetical protein